MTSPLLAQGSPYGRLYRHPLTTGIEDHTIEEALKLGLLVPSITNIIDTLNKPFLTTWHGRLAAKAAIDTIFDYPGLIQSKPRDAEEYIKNAAPRKLVASGILGDAVHGIVEQLSRGEEVLNIESKLEPYIESFHKFRSEFAPEYHYFEVTCFGSIIDPVLGELKYAGTADFLATVNGIFFVGDYKTGKSVHTEASMQLAALANAKEMILESGEIITMPKVDSGLVVHLTPKGFALHKSDPFGDAWDVFSELRKLWDFHVANLASKKPLLLSTPIRKANKLNLDVPIMNASLRSGLLREE